MPKEAQTNPKKGRRRLRIALVIMGGLIAVTIVAIYIAFAVVELSELDVKNDIVVDAEISYSDLMIAQFIKRYPDVAESLSTKAPQTYAIPGLVRAKNIRIKGTKKGKVGYATDMTPQGLAVTDKYVLISAYSKSKDFHSVIWVLDKQTRTFIKTIVLDNTDHVGGLAYDPEHNRLWVAAKEPDGKSAAVGMLSMNDVEAYDFDKSKSCLEYERLYLLSGIKATSYLTMYNNVMYAGYFDANKDGVLGMYLLDDEGLPAAVKEGTYPTIEPHRTVTTPDEIQGVAMIDDLLVFTKSYGTDDAHLLVYENANVDDLEDMSDKNCWLDVAMPPYLEQPCVDGAQLYVVFESSAKEYRNRIGVLGIDQVLKFDIYEDEVEDL